MESQEQLLCGMQQGRATASGVERGEMGEVLKAVWSATIENSSEQDEPLDPSTVSLGLKDNV